MYTHILFDFDGTLVDSREAIIETTRLTFLEFGLPAPEPEIISYYFGIPLERSFPLMGGEIYPIEKTQLIIDRYRALYVPICDRETIVFSGIPELLKRLNDAGLTLGIVTSKKSSIVEHVLNHKNISDLFTVIVGPDHVTNFKPHPETALQAIEKLKADPKKTLVVGDAIFDIEMGKGAGVDTCGVTWATHSIEQLVAATPTYIAHTVAELAAVIFGDANG